MRRVLALAAHDLGWLRREPWPLVTMLLMPGVLMLFTRPIYRSVLLQLGVDDANGADLAVPGLAVMFSFFMVGIIAESIFREHGWRTWDRLRVSPLRDWELFLGKLLPGFLLVVLQLTVLFLFGWLWLGLRARGSIAALALVLVALAACVVSFAVALCAIVSSRRQAFAYERLIVLAWAGLGGALVPVSLLPAWTLWPARLTPVYWAVDGFRVIVLDGRGIPSVLLHLAALAAFTVVFAAVARWRFRMDSEKTHWL
jgi:ABC-2 type transport system permease protein